MSVARHSIMIGVLLVLPAVSWAASARGLIRQGNDHYAQGKYDAAAAAYEKALALDGNLAQARYNRACAAYQQGQYDQAIEDYRALAAQSEDPDLALRAKYNLGNSYFQRGQKLAQQQPQAALEDLEQAVEAWRQVQQMAPKHPHVDRNIEVGRLWIRDLKQQIERQEQQPSQQDPSEPSTSDPNSMQQPQNTSQADPNSLGQDQPQQQPSQQDSTQEDEPQPQDTQQPQSADASEDEQQAEPTEQPDPSSGEPQDEQLEAVEAKVNDILEQERQARKMRILLRQRHQSVEKDW